MFKKNPGRWLSILLSVVFIILAFLQVGFLESLELATYDLRMKLRAAGPEANTDIAIVEIDDQSITNLGRWPWPRTLIGEMIGKLNEKGARIIGLNVVFSEPEVREGLKQVEALEARFKELFGSDGGSGVQAFLEELEAAGARLNTDAQLEAALKDSGNVVLPVFFEIGHFPVPDAEYPPYLADNGLIQAQGPVLGYMYPARKITAPIEAFSQAAYGLGHINIIADPDGAVRREILLVNYRGLPFPSFALKMALKYQGTETNAVQVFNPESGKEGLRIGNQEVPTNPNLDFYITFTQTEAYPRFSFYDVLNDKVKEPTVFKDKIVILGVSATGVDIPQVTPLDKHMSSSLFMANSVQNLLNGGFIVRSGIMDLVELGVLVVIGLFLALLLPRLRARLGALASIGFLAAIVLVGVYLFIGPGVWLKITYPVLLIMLGYATVTTSRYFVSEAGRDKAEGESAEVNRMLGLQFQDRGQLDMAFDKFRRVPVDDEMKSLLYNLALDYERKRMFNKAVNVYKYIQEHDPGFKDIAAKIKKLTAASETMIFGLGTGATQAEDGTMMIDENTRPTLGRYEIVKELGKGAMGIVYMGKDPKINRVTAIKTIRFTDEYEEAEAERIKEQFFREAETAGILSHPNIVTIYDVGEDHDLSYIAMEFLEGADLKDYSAPDNLLPMKDVLRLVADVADALGYAHSKGVVHRDIKPANIMYLKNGMAKVTDFGIARAMASSKTKTGVVKGTPFYMSPEQIRGKKVDGRSDIFSLGVVLYELLTGVQPFHADDLTALIYQITQGDPDPIQEHNPRVPKAVGQIVAKALTKDLDKRYQKAEQMAQHLRIVLQKMEQLAGRKTKSK